MMKKSYRLAKKNVRGQDVTGMRPRVERTETASQKLPEHDPIILPKRTESGQNGRPFEVARWSWPHHSSHRIEPASIPRTNFRPDRTGSEHVLPANLRRGVCYARRPANSPIKGSLFSFQVDSGRSMHALNQDSFST